MINRMPKYNVNDIVIVEGMSYGSGKYFGHVVGVIKDVINHRDTGEVFYHIIFNSGIPRKVFEYEIETKFNTYKFRNGYLIHRSLLVKMYHNKDYKFLSEKEFIEWVYENFEETDIKKKTDYTVYNPLNDRPAYYNYRYDPKLMEYMYPVKSSLKEITERIVASPIKIDIDEKKKEEIKKMVNEANKAVGEWRSRYYWEIALAYKKIIFNGPCTIILWADGTKTIAKLYEDIDKFDPEKGVAICFMKKVLGHTETNKILRKATKQYADETTKSSNTYSTIQETLKTIAEKLYEPLISFNKEDKNDSKS